VVDLRGKKYFRRQWSNGEKAIYPRQIYLIRSVQMKNWKRMKKITQIGICVKGPILRTNEWQNLPTTDWSVQVRCSSAFRLWTGRGAFSPFYTRRVHRSVRYDSACQFPPRFFLPRLPPSLLPRHARNPLLFWTISTAAFDIPLPRPTYVLSHMRAQYSPPVMQYIFYFIRVFFPPRTHASYHAPLTTMMSIIRIFCRSRVVQPLYPRSYRSTVSLALQLANLRNDSFIKLHALIIEPLSK